MLLKLECNKCRQEEAADLVQLIQMLIQCAEKEHIFAGFYCDSCHRKIENDFDAIESGFDEV